MRRTAVAVGLLLGVVSISAAEDRVFFGNLHSHTSYSDGSGTPDEAFRHARHTAGLDFLAITEHNHARAESGAGDRQDGILIATNPSLYTGPQAEALIPMATHWTVDGEFVALYGQEFSSISSGNHINVFEVPTVIDVPNGRFDRLVNDWIPSHLDSTGQTALVQLNHPALFDDDAKEYGRDDFPSSAEWISKLDGQAELIEVLNGPAMTRSGPQRAPEVMERDYLAYLRLGFHVAPTADQDNHYFTWGTATDARTGVVTDALTKPKILEALRSRHVYATEDRTLRLIFRVNGQLCGDRMVAPASNTELTITYSIQDDDEPTASYTIQVISNTIGGNDDDVELAAITQDGDTSGSSITGVRYTGGPQYVLFKVTQLNEDGGRDRSWTAPAWFDAGTTPATAPPASAPREASLVASKNSPVYHVSLECRSAQQILEKNRVTGSDARRGRQKHFGCPR